MYLYYYLFSNCINIKVTHCINVKVIHGKWDNIQTCAYRQNNKYLQTLYQYTVYIYIIKVIHLIQITIQRTTQVTRSDISRRPFHLIRPIDMSLQPPVQAQAHKIAICIVFYFLLTLSFIHDIYISRCDFSKLVVYGINVVGTVTNILYLYYKNQIIEFWE